jgi:hypothetical protein
MLGIYNRLAKRLYGLRSILWAFGILSVGAFAGVLFLADGSIDGSYALAALTFLLWALWLLALAYGFIEDPPSVDPASRFWVKLGTRLRRSVLWLLALGLAALLIVAVIMTARTVGIVLAAQA